MRTKLSTTTSCLAPLPRPYNHALPLHCYARSVLPSVLSAIAGFKLFVVGPVHSVVLHPLVLQHAIVGAGGDSGRLIAYGSLRGADV